MLRIERLIAIVFATSAFLASGAGVAQTTAHGKGPGKTSTSAVGPAVVVGNGTLSSDGLPQSTVRVFRDGAPANCSTKPFPGTIDSGGFAYQTQSYTNTGPGRCVTLTLTAACVGGGSDNGVFLLAYSGDVDPTNLATNYLGDAGLSTGAVGFPPVSMRLNLAQNQTIVLAISQVNDADTAPVNRCAYSVADDVQLPVPATSPLTMALMAALLALVGAFMLRRRAGQR